jgi:hypothetical protein
VGEYCLNTSAVVVVGFSGIAVVVVIIAAAIAATSSAGLALEWMWCIVHAGVSCMSVCTQARDAEATQSSASLAEIRKNSVPAPDLPFLALIRLSWK